MASNPTYSELKASCVAACAKSEAPDAIGAVPCATSGKAVNPEPKTPRALVGMSGGVDSSVVPHLLMQQGIAVTGTMLKLFDNDDIGKTASRVCCTAEDEDDCRAVAVQLGFPFYVFNFKGAFGTEVVDRFCASYVNGMTPNPCVDCNRFVKFAALHQRRRELGFDYVATGHYARREYDATTGRYLLKCGLDPLKDQSYMLFYLTQDMLKHTLFPIGELAKDRVREIAEDLGLATAGKRESQDICFVPDGDYASFIERRVGACAALEPGPITDLQGKKLGTHTGVVRYTVGQRKGIGLAAPAPLYVCAKDAATNTVLVGTKEESLTRELLVRDINLIAVSRVEGPMRVKVKAHYRQRALPATLEQIGEDELRILFDEAVPACAPGQAAVAYLDDVVVGGGMIAKVKRAAEC